MPEFPFKWLLLVIAVCPALVSAADPVTEPVTAATAAAGDEQARSQTADLINQGKQLFRASKFDEAGKIFNSVLQIDPNEAQAYYWLGQIDIKQGHVNEGIGKIVRSTELAPDNALLWQTLGQIYEEIKQYDKAEAAYTRAVEVNPELLLARLSLAIFHENRGHYATALDMYDDLIFGHPRTREASIAQTRVRKLYPLVVDDMIKQIQSDVVLSEDQIDVFAKRAQRLISRGQFDLAIKFLLPLTERYADNAKGFYWLGQAYVGKGDLDNGTVALRKSLELAPDNNALREQLLNAYLRNKDIAQAEKMLADIEASEPKYKNLDIIRRNIAFSKAAQFEKDGDLEAAIREYKSIQAVFPKEPSVLAGLIRLYEKESQPGLANQLIRELLEYHPENVAVRKMLIGFYQGRNDEESVKREALKLLDLTENEADRRVALDALGFGKAIDLMNEKKYGQALQIFNGIKEDVPDEFLVLMNMGVIYQRQHQYKDAIETFSKVIDLQPRAAPAYIKLGDVYSDTEKYEDAIDSYTKALEVGKGTQAEKDATERLGKMEREIISIGKKKLADGEISDAEKLFGGIVARDPDSAQGQFWLGKVLLKKKNIEAGMSGIERSAAMAPYNWQMQKELGKTYRDAKLYKKSLDAYNRAYELAPDQYSLLLEIALLDQLLGDQEGYHEKLRQYLVAEKNTQKHIEALDLLGYSAAKKHLEDGDYQTALNSLESIHEIVPEEPLVMAALAEAYRQKGMMKQAEEMIRQASKVDPKNGDLKYQYALLLKDMGQIDKAIEQVEKARGSPHFTRGDEATALYDELHRIKADRMLAVVKAHRHLSDDDQKRVIDAGIAMVRDKAYEPAIRFLEPAARKARNSPELYYWLGEAYFGNGDQKQGIKSVKRSHELAPGNDKLELELARLNYEAGNEDEAIAIYQDMISRGSKEVMAYPRLVEIYMKKGDRENAIKYVKQFNELEGHEGLQTTALNMVGLSEALDKAKNKEYSAAEVILDELITVAPRHPLVVRSDGLVKMALGKYDEAERLFKRLIEIAPNDYAGYRSLAEIYIQSNRHDEALRIFEQAKSQIRKKRESADLTKQLVTLYKNDAQDFLNTTSDQQLADPAILAQGIGKARNLVQMNQYPLAEQLLDRILSLAPDDPQANYWQGKVYLHTKRADQGLPLIEKSVRLAPDNKRLKWELGQSYETAGRYEEALKLYTEVEDVIKEARPREHLLRARINLGRKQYNQAIAEYRKYLDLKGEDTAIEFIIASIYEQQGAFGKADAIYDDMIKRRPKDAHLRARILSFYSKRGDEAAVKRQALAILKLQPEGEDHNFALDKLGFSQVRDQLKQGNLDDAITGLKDLLEIAPDEIDVMLTLAIVYKRKGETSLSESTYRKILAIDPENSGAYLGLGGLYLLEGDREQAISYLEKASDYDPRGQNGNNARKMISRIDVERARNLASRKRVKEAIAYMEHMLKYVPNNTRARDYLATLYAQSGEKDKAIELFEQVASEDKQNQHAYQMLARLYSDQNELDKSIEAEAHAISLETDPDTAASMADTLSIIVVKKLFNENNLLLAFRELDRLKTESPDSVQANLYLGILYSKVGDMDNAIRSYEEVLRLNPTNYNVRFTLAVMYERKNEDELALAQYQKIINEAGPGIVLERARSRIEAVKDRINPLTSNMSYRMNVGENVDENGAITKSFSSILNVGLDLAYKPIKPLSLIGRFGITYSGNHTDETDTFAPLTGFNAIYNTEDYQLAAGYAYVKQEGLLLEDQNGATTNVFTRGLIRFDNPLDLVKLIEEKKETRQETGITSMTRRKAAAAPELRKERPPLDLTDNPDLKKLLEAMQQEVKEEIRRHVVVKGDTLWDISAELLDDPWLWPEIWQANPKIENPHLIFPGDTITLVYINGRPKLLLQRPGLEPEILTVDEGMKLYSDAIKLIKAGKYAEALVNLEKILDFIANDLKTNLATAIALQGLKRYDEAETYYRKVLELDNTFDEARFMLAGMYQEAGRLNQAIDELEKIIATSKDELLVRDATEKLIGLYHDYALALIDTLPGAGADQAAGIAAQVIRFGVRLYGLDARDKAKDVFEKLVAWLPENADAHYWLAKIQIEYGEYDKAIDHLQISVSLEPDNSIYHEELAVLLEQMNDIDLAREQYMLIAQSTTSESQADWAMMHVDLLLARQSVMELKYDQAIGIYEDLMRNYPDDISIALLAGELYLSVGDMTAAEKVYRRVLELDKTSVPAAMGLLRIYSITGDRGKLIESAKLLASLDLSAEQRSELRRQLGFQVAIDLINRGEYAAALEYMNAIRDIMGDDTLVMLNIAILHQALGEYDQAERILLELVEKDPDNLTVHLRLGILYAEMDRIEEAVAEFRTVISLGAGTDVEQPAREWLAVMREKQEAKFKNLDAGEPVPKSLGVTFSYNNFEPSGVSYANSLSYKAGLDFNYPAGDFGNWNFSYDRTVNENEHVWGTDYAYVSDGFGISVGRPVLPKLFPGLYGNLSLTQTLYHYDNYDTNALYALGRSVKRENVRNALNATLTYRFDSQFSIIVTYNKIQNRSNLPLGRLYVVVPTFPTPIPATAQGTTLGDYDVQNISVTGRLRF